MDWKTFTEGKSNKQIAEYILKAYIKDNSFKGMTKKFGCGHSTFQCYIHRNRSMIEKELTEVYGQYKAKAGENRKSNREKPIGATTGYSAVFKTLPKEISYNDFLNKIFNVNTGKFTGEQLARIAYNKYGVKVIDNLTNKVIV